MSAGAVRRTTWSTLGGAITVVGAVVGLHLLGTGRLAAPPCTSIDALETWARSVGPVGIGVVTLRLAALALGYHVIATTVLAVAGRVLERPNLVRLADAATLPPLRGTVRRLAGLGLSASALLASPLASAGAAPGERPAPTVVDRAGSAGLPVLARIGPDGAGLGTSSPVVLRRLAPEAGGTASLHRLAPVPTADADGATLRSLGPAPAPDRAPDPAARPAESAHVVQPGDHLWSITEDRLADGLGRPPTDAEVVPHWRALVAANPQLADPDLVLPGDRLVLPPLGDGPGPGTPGRATLRRA